MKQFAKLMLLTLGFGLLAALTGLVGPQPNRTNAAVAAAVNVINTPGVNANQSGPWSVGINGTPNVNIVNTPTVSLAQGTTVGVTGGNINFSNTAQTPIFTRDKDNAALMPFQTTLCFGNSNNGNPCSHPSSFPVPNGQRVVIEYISQLCVESGAFKVRGMGIATTAGGVRAFFTLSPGEADPLLSGRVASQQTRIYADTGTNIDVSPLVTTGDTNPGAAYCIVVLSGYLVTP